MQIMQESHTSASSPAVAKRAPLHDEIAQCAQDLWIHYGKPTDRDLAIWLEAEKMLLAGNAPSTTRESDSAPGASSQLPLAKRARASTNTRIRGGATRT